MKNSTFTIIFSFEIKSAVLSDVIYVRHSKNRFEEKDGF